MRAAEIAAGASAATAASKEKQDKITNERAQSAESRAVKESYAKSLGERFTMPNKDGIPVEDKAAVADYLKHVDATAKAQYAAAVKSGDKAQIARWTDPVTGKARGAHDLDPSDQAYLEQMYRTKKRFRDAAGLLPTSGTFVDTLDLTQYEPQLAEDGRMRTRSGSHARPNDLRYAEGPANIILPDFKTTTDQYGYQKGLRR